MKIEYKIGNLIEASEFCILHGCNAQGRMGSGVAKTIRSKFPEEYIKEYNLNGLHLGQVIWADSNGKLIANGITQEFYGYNKNTYIDYNAINRVMWTVHDAAVALNFDVAMPLIGAGLGGGSWKKISEIIENMFTDIVPVVYTLDGKIPVT